MPGDALARYLDALGNAEAGAAAGALVARLGRRLDRAQVDFDLLPRLASRLGFGLQPEHGDTWSELLSRVEGEGWCSRGEREALLRWPGRRRVRIGSDRLRFDRSLSHVKLVCRPGSPTTAKAYFGAFAARDTSVAEHSEPRARVPEA